MTEPVPLKERGEAIATAYQNPGVEGIVNVLIGKAMRALPVGSIFEIRGKATHREVVDGYGRVLRTEPLDTQHWGLAWLWMPKMQQETQLFRKPVAAAEHGPLGGYLLVARLKSESVAA